MEILTRMASGHQIVSTAVLDLRDLVLGMEEADTEDKVMCEEWKKGPVDFGGKGKGVERGPEDSEATDHNTEKNGSEPQVTPHLPQATDAYSGLADSLAYLFEPGRVSGNTAPASTAGSQGFAPAHRSQEISSGFKKLPGEVQAEAGPSDSVSTAAVLANALNKRKADTAFHDPEEVTTKTIRRVPKRRVPVVLHQTESQLERRRKYAEEQGPRTYKGPSRRRTAVIPGPRSTQEILDEYEEELRNAPHLLENSETDSD